MFQRRTTGSVVCPSCGSLVGVRDEKCYMCGRRNPGLWGFTPVLRQLGADLGFVPFVIGACVTVYVLTLLFSGDGMIGAAGLVSLLAPSSSALLRFGVSGAIPVFVNHWWWTILSASWLHANLIHILFNMMAVRNLGPAAASIIGPGRTVVIYVIGGAAGFLLSSVVGWYVDFSFIPILGQLLHGAPYTVGASASVCALLGALSHYGRVSGSSLIRNETKSYALGILVIGVMMPGIDNFAHAGGFFGGYAVSMFFNPLTKERGDHLIAAAACLGASFLAIFYSFLTV